MPFAAGFGLCRTVYSRGDPRPHNMHHKRTDHHAPTTWIVGRINDARKVHDLAQQIFSGPATQGRCSPALAAIVPPHPTPVPSPRTRHLLAGASSSSPPHRRPEGGTGTGMGRVEEERRLTCMLPLDNFYPTRGAQTLLVDGSGGKGLLSSIRGGAMAAATHRRGGGVRCWHVAAVGTKGGGRGKDGGGNQIISSLLFFCHNCRVILSRYFLVGILDEKQDEGRSCAFRFRGKTKSSTEH